MGEKSKSVGDRKKNHAKKKRKEKSEKEREERKFTIRKSVKVGK
jgi:hypothetical protein